MIDTIAGWSKISEYNNKFTIIMGNLVENMWLNRYPWTEEITYDQGLELFGNDLRKFLIEI